MELHASHGTQCTNNPFPLQISFISNSPYCLPNHSFKVSLENSALDQLSNDPIVDTLVIVKKSSPKNLSADRRLTVGRQVLPEI